MSTKHLRNISLSKFESFLELCGCKYIKTEGGHAKYFRSDLFRPIMFQTHIDPVPEFIIKNALRPLGYSRNDFFDILEGRKIVNKVGTDYKVESPLKSKK